jgi:hypothetical protein
MKGSIEGFVEQRMRSGKEQWSSFSSPSAIFFRQSIFFRVLLSLHHPQLQVASNFEDF